MHRASTLERRLVLKQDLVILPLLSLAYFFSYAVCKQQTSVPNDRLTNLFTQDRGQIGDARLMGLEKDLDLTAPMYYDCLMMFCGSSPNHLWFRRTLADTTRQLWD